MIKFNYKNQIVEIDDNQTVLLLSKDSLFIKETLKEIAGINESDVTIDNKKVYDNKTYFRNRVYIDNEYQYINTLNASKIANVLLKRYQKILNEEDFKRLVKNTHIRFEYNIDKRDRFNVYSNAVINNIFVLSLMTYRIVYKALDELKNDLNCLNVLKEEYSLKKGNLLGTNINNIRIYKGIIDKVVILNEKAFVFDPSANVILLNGKLGIEFDDEIIYNNKEHYYYRCELLRNVEFLNSIKSKKYKLVSLYEMGDDYE